MLVSTRKARNIRFKKVCLLHKVAYSGLVTILKQAYVKNNNFIKAPQNFTKYPCFLLYKQI